MCKPIVSWQDGVKRYLVREGRSIEWLSKVSNTGYSHLGACMNNRRIPSRDVLVRLELVMHWPPGTLCQFLRDTEHDVQFIDEEGYDSSASR